jgi:hypothetical protein
VRCRAEILDVMRVFGYKLLAFMEEVTNQSENHLKELAESKARSTFFCCICNVAWRPPDVGSKVRLRLWSIYGVRSNTEVLTAYS